MLHEIFCLVWFTLVYLTLFNYVNCDCMFTCENSATSAKTVSEAVFLNCLCNYIY